MDLTNRLIVCLFEVAVHRFFIKWLKILINMGFRLFLESRKKKTGGVLQIIYNSVYKTL